jgi:hypothetical protein
VIVDHQVNRAEFARDTGESILDRKAIDQIDRDGDCRSACAGNQRSRLVDLACRSCQDGDLGASLRLMKRNLAANPACPATVTTGTVPFSSVIKIFLS